MNNTHRITRIAVLACGAFLAVLPAIAQDQDAPPPPMAQAPAGGGHHGGGGEKRMKELAEQLNLNPDQQKVFRDTMMDQRQKMQALQADTTVDKKDRRQKMMAIHEDANARIKAVLNDDQKAKFDAFEAQQREQMRERRQEGGAMPPAAGDGPPPPPPAA